MEPQELGIELDDLWRKEYALVSLCQTLIQFVTNEDWEGLARRMTAQVSELVRKQVHSAGRENYLLRLRGVAEDDVKRVEQEIKQALKDACSVQTRGGLGDRFIKIREREDFVNRKSNLLALAFADRLTDLVFPAARRAAKLTDLAVRKPLNQKAGKYLEEASLCYFYELYTSSAVMCRAALEAVLREQIGRLAIPQAKELEENDKTLGGMLTFAKRPELRSSRVVPPDAWQSVTAVNRIGSRAVHSEPVPEKDAFECLVSARLAIDAILR